MARPLRVVLVGGIPGTKTPHALSKFLAWMGAHYPGEASRWAVAPKFEDLLIVEYNKTVDSPASNIIPLLDEPRPILRDLWLATAGVLRSWLDARSEAEGNVESVLVPVHLSWYHQEIREYIEVLDVERLKAAIAPHQVAAVVCLIDDIHDIYVRLREPGGLYDRYAATFDERMARRGHGFLRHLRILDWRARELLVAESVANRIGCRLAVLATKHQPSVAFHYLTGKPASYFSHPISEVRELEASGIDRYRELAKTVKEDMWDIQSCLAAELPLFQPTCIDEFRLRRDGPPALAPRFYPLGSYGHTLWPEVDATDNVIYDDLPAEAIATLTPEEADTAQDLGGIVLSFVENQVTSRDLQLVTQARNLVVYRPRFNGNLSRGVGKEIAYFDRLAQWAANRDAETNPGRLVLIDSDHDKAEFPVRQLLVAMVAATEAGEWSVPLGKAKMLQYQARISTDTRALVDAAMSNAAEVESAVRSVLRDVGHDGPFTVTKVIAERPLGESEYLRQQEKKTALFSTFYRALTPFGDRPPYAGRLVLNLDGKPADTLAAEVLEALA